MIVRGGQNICCVPIGVFSQDSYYPKPPELPKLSDGTEMTMVVQANVQGLDDAGIGSEVSISWSARNCKVLV